MTHDLEDRLVSALRADADEAPPAGDLLGAVQVRARRRGRRRMALTGAAAAVAVVAAAAAVTELPGHRKDSLRAPSTVAGHGDTGPLIAGSLPPLRSPMTATWLPPGLARVPHVSFDQSGYNASYRDARQADRTGVELRSSDHDMTLRGDGVTHRSTTLGGHPATLATTQGMVSLGWEVSTGSWRVVEGGNDWADVAVVRRIAEGLLDQPTTAASPLEMDLVPRDYELADWSTDGRLVFVPVGATQQWHKTGGVADAVQIAARRFRDDLVGNGSPVTVSGHAGWLLPEEGGRQSLVVRWSDRVCLVFDVPAWDRQDVLDLAAAVRWTGDLPPQEG